MMASHEVPVADPVFSAQAPAAARQQDEKPRGVQLTAAELFALATSASNNGDTQRAETIYRALEHDPHLEIRNEARFRHARLLAGLHKLSDAALLYRAILDEKPDATRVRLELAATLAQMGKLSAARQELRQAEAAGLPPEVAQIVDRYRTALRSMKPFGGTFELAVAPDSNVNRATNATTLDTVIAPLTLSSDARAQSGLGFKGSGQFYARAKLGRHLTLVPRVSGSSALYRVYQFNDVSGSAQLGLEWQSHRDRITPSAGHTWRWYGGSLYARTRSVSLDWLRPAGKRAQLDATVGVSAARYVRNDLQDGTIYNASVAYERALTTRSGGSLSLSAYRQTARDRGYATASAGLGATYWHDLGKMTLFGTFTANRLEGDARLFLFRDRRREWYMRGGTGAVFRQVKVSGFSPVFRVPPLPLHRRLS